MKKAFTLIELLVVIAIIAILAGVLFSSMRGATESARSAKCLVNMRSLVSACHAKSMESKGFYPPAGSLEDMKVGRTGITYTENPGWISWLSKNKYPKGFSTSHQTCPVPGVFSPDDDIQHAYTNGAIWKAIGSNANCYKCPTMLNLGGRSADMAWTYVMNMRFGYDWTGGSGSAGAPSMREGKITDRADRLLMFAEINVDTNEGGLDIVSGSSGGTGDYRGDSILEFDDGTGTHSEKIGFNHISGKRKLAHVVFLDGHVERLEKFEKGNLDDLTKWLCQAYDVTISGGAYEKIEDTATIDQVE